MKQTAEGGVQRIHQLIPASRTGRRRTPVLDELLHLYPQARVQQLPQGQKLPVAVMQPVRTHSTLCTTLPNAFREVLQAMYPEKWLVFQDVSVLKLAAGRGH